MSASDGSEAVVGIKVNHGITGDSSSPYLLAQSAEMPRHPLLANFLFPQASLHISHFLSSPAGNCAYQARGAVAI